MFRKSRRLVIQAGVAVFLIISATTLSFSQPKPQVVAKESKKVTELRNAVDAEIDALKARLIEINNWMYQHPERGFLEFEAAKILTDELKAAGFEVEMGVPGLPGDFDKLKVIGGVPADYSGPPRNPDRVQSQVPGGNRRNR